MHQITKAKQLQCLKNRREKVWGWFIEHRKTLSCVVCGENHPVVLDFHHIDPKGKKAGVPTIAAKGTIGQLQREMAKCVVLCANCHRKLHVADSGLMKIVLDKASRSYEALDQCTFLSELGMGC